MSTSASHLNHISILTKYITHEKIFFILLAISIILFYKFNFSKIRKRIKNYIFLVATLFLFTLNFHQIVQSVARSAEDQGLVYYNWDFPQNQKINGLAVHLIQTGKRPAPVAITSNQRADFQKLIDNATPLETSPTTFIMILCESCWHDENTFKEAFTPLSNKADAVLRGVSPVYGGGTPNATFEFLTALPTHHPSLSGIIYQEYRDYFATKTSTLPAHLQSNGFRTESIHNYLGGFWFRSTVEPKLGFDRFIGIEDIDYTAVDDDYPSDTVLFGKALSVIKENQGKSKLFMHLATMYTHGPYRVRNGDGGVEYYREKLSKSVLDISKFIDDVRLIDKNSVILIYGDHKPGLPIMVHFLNEGKHLLGDVPVLLFDSNRDRATSAKSELNGKPFYCMSSSLSRIYYGIELPAGRYTEASCRAYNGDSYEAVSRSVPDWVYSAALFDNRL
ncbi:sulfatase-like hydrolase/transferase [Ochrobactrum sp. S1502_03]|uniref:sulfatase-like hydrolase/transferase n=1 Tax=Ochrobactrum sp. S1502_03 TaxID=3108451 RepID=UPI0037CB344B